jgi:probable F420-dependent oxidoreductase
MRYAFLPPTRSVKYYDTWVDGHHLAELGVACEEAGIDAFAVTDHPFPPDAWLKNGGHHSFDPFVTLSFLAQATTNLTLLTNILVAGYRSPYITARAIASLDLLSGGRLITGMAVGYLEPEFAAVGADFAGRGKKFDAGLEAMIAAWSGESVHITDGPFPADGHTMVPRPAQQPHPRIWIGGNGAPAIRRVAEVADGWMPISQSEAMAEITGTDLIGLQALGERIEKLRARRVELGRDPEFDVCYTPASFTPADKQIALIQENFAEYERAGINWLIVESHGRDFDGCLAEIEKFGRELPR